MTDYLLASGTNKAPATRAPAHMAAWLDAKGYRIVRSPGPGSTDPDDPDLVALIAALIDWQPSEEDHRHSIVRQVLAAVANRSVTAPDIRRAA